MKPSYPYFDYIKERLGHRIRFLGYLAVSGKKNLRQAYNSLSGDDYIKLGFKGKPTYELLREFVYERIGVDRLQGFFKHMLKELVSLLRKKNIPVGEHVFQDATDIRSLKHDKEAKYSSYYKHSGYKVDYTIDVNLEIPLDCNPIEITEDEGRNLISSQEEIRTLGVKERIRVVDDKILLLLKTLHIANSKGYRYIIG